MGSWPVWTLVLSVVFGGLAWWLRLGWLRIPAVLLLVVLGFMIWFFRDPERTPAHGIASPADGKVVRIDIVEDPELGRCDRLAIFMSPLDVHVNRFPCDGRVLTVTHIPGGHIPAFNKDADRNERVVTILETPNGRLKTVQIAGTVARRIVPYIAGGQNATKGVRMGLIKFGSRCDVLVPVGRVRWSVALGARLKAGSDSIAEWRA